MKRIHVVGVSPRTGTTLMSEALKTCFQIDYYANHEEKLVTRAPDAPKMYLSKFPGDIMMVGPSLQADPDLYVICMVRDPRDIICSIHKKDTERYWAGLNFWNTYTKEFQKIKQYPRFIPIKYENFVSNPDEIQTKISKNIPFLEKQTPFSKYHEAAKVTEGSKKALRSVRPIKPNSVGKWKEHKPRLKGQIQLHGPITKDLITYGYEKDNRWLKKLDGIEPDLAPSHHKELMSFFDKRLRKFGKYLEAGRRIIEQLINRRIRITHPKKWF